MVRLLRRYRLALPTILLRRDRQIPPPSRRIWRSGGSSNAQKQEAAPDLGWSPPWVLPRAKI